MKNEKLNEQLIKAILDKNCKKVHYILALKADVNTRACGGIGCSALSVAKKIGALKIANLLEERGGIEINPSSEEADELGKKIFDFGADDKEEIKRLFIMGANLEVTNILGDTLFVDAVRNSKYTVTNLLIELGADIHAKTREGRNALFYAVRYFNEDLFFDLLERGIDVHVVDKDGCNILFEAIGCPGGGDRLQRLIDKGVNLNQISKDTGTTPLGLACLWDNSHDALKLIEAGCCVNVRNDRGKTPLIDVVCSPRIKIEVLEAMLEREVDIDYEGYMGRSALVWALNSSDGLNSNNVWKKIALLIEHGVKIKESEQKLIDEKSKWYGREDMIKEAFVKREERFNRKKEEERKKIEEIKRKEEDMGKVEEINREEQGQIIEENKGIGIKKTIKGWWQKLGYSR